MLASIRFVLSILEFEFDLDFEIRISRFYVRSVPRRIAGLILRIMSTLSPRAASTHSAAQRGANYKLAVNSFDRTATLLIALLAMTGLAVLGLSIVFFANKFDSPVEAIEFVPVEATSPNANQGLADEPDPPGIEEAPDLAEPQLQDTLNTLTALISDEQALLSDEAIDAANEAGKGEGLGDSRQPGPGGDGVVERVPRWERWKIRWEPASSGDFTAWLDQYDIRIGVLGRDNKVHLAHHFTPGSPTVEAVDPLEYAAWGRTVPADGPMPALTQRLARDADIARHGRLRSCFFPLK